MDARKPKPDDSEYDELIADSESIQEALAAIADKYGADVTNNEPRWQDGVYLRHLGDFMGDVLDAFKRFSKPIESEKLPDRRRAELRARVAFPGPQHDGKRYHELSDEDWKKLS